MVSAAGLLIYRVINNTNEYLLLQASYKPYHWTPPKGHVDPGETEWQAAIRETKEEAAIDEKDVEIDKNFHHIMHYDTPKEGRKTVHYWLAKLLTGDVKLSHEHTNWDWKPLETAVTLTKFPEMEKMLRSAEAYLAKKKDG
ncbi:Bis(5'-nucleosyl)-tetraphosphatase [asymmetrical] [Aphelenchoides besseyi]|nr:Bis(5'-nucleosyl)-tetraphosphatase [asymmetrical] [Aphelenchoides besseyi]